MDTHKAFEQERCPLSDRLMDIVIFLGALAVIAAILTGVIG